MILFKKILFRLIILNFALAFWIRRKFKKTPNLRIGFITEEFFHEDLHGFGGYGMTLKYITDYFNSNGHFLKGDILLTRLADIPKPREKRYHNANVIFIPKSTKGYVLNFLNYGRMINRHQVDAFISIDHNISYEYPLLGFPNIPWVIWLKDPRDLREWEKIYSVSLELKTTGRHEVRELLRSQAKQGELLRKVIKKSRYFGRKICFAIEVISMTEMARRQYGMPEMKPFFLPKPVPIPKFSELTFSQKPSFLFLGRLDPVKRPWIYFELAKRFTETDFYVAGTTHFPYIMDKVVSQYSDIPNLKFLGRIVEQEKDDILRHVWATINTSVHEALPVSFLESFAYGKPVISCQNPDNLVNRFGVYTGEISGNGNDSYSLDAFSSAVNELLCTAIDKRRIGLEARQYVQEVHSFENYESNLRKILDS